MALDREKIRQIVASVEKERDPTLKALGVAYLCTVLFEEIGYRSVVVGGSAIELLTEGEYMSGDVDLCFDRRPRPPMRQVAELMAIAGASGGPRSFKIAGVFVDILGEVESLAKTEFRQVIMPDGTIVLVAKPEDLLAERVLGSVYPQPNEAARLCAKKLIGFALAPGSEVDWAEAERVAALPEYGILEEFGRLRREVENELREE